jgi:predicted RNA binding protein YcfA (HicA-like mRNA interferase family)
MPRKIRQLLKDLEKAGFEFEPGKGSHRKMVHPLGLVVVVSGQLGEDARHYQEKDVKQAIKRVKK